jgi:hypothetical protein
LPAPATEIVIVAPGEFSSLRPRVIRRPATVLAQSGLILHELCSV